MRTPTTWLTVRVYRGAPYYEALWRHDGRRIKRRIGRAWVEQDSAGRWKPRRGRVPDGYYDEKRAGAVAEQLAANYQPSAERTDRERRGATFADVAAKYLVWLEKVKGAKPATLADYRYQLAPTGRIMTALGDRPAAKVVPRDVEALLESIAATGVKPRTVNKVRALVRAVFNYGAKSSTFALTSNPVRDTDKRREAERAPLDYYSPEEIEALARTLEEGLHRTRKGSNDELRRELEAKNHQDAELVRVAAYTGLRLGELLALRWGDIDFTGAKIVVQRAVSAGVETSTKSGKVRRVPLPDQAVASLNRLSRRGDFTSPDDLVFCNSIGRRLDRYSLRNRFDEAREATGLRPLRLHDLRHTYGSLLARAGIDLVTIQAAMGHSSLTTTSVYLHARPAHEQAAAFSAAFASDTRAMIPGHVPAST